MDDGRYEEKEQGEQGARCLWVPEPGHEGKGAFLVAGRNVLRYSYFYQDIRVNSKTGRDEIGIKGTQTARARAMPTGAQARVVTCCREGYRPTG